MASHDKSKVRVVFSQIETMAIKYAGTRLEEANWPGLTGYEIAALSRALDKLTLGLAGAHMRDAERGVSC